MRLSLDKALAVGNQLEVEAISEYEICWSWADRFIAGINDPYHVCLIPPDGTQHIVLSPSLATQCGYSMESDPWGNTRIYTSLLGCYVDNRVCLSKVIVAAFIEFISFLQWLAFGIVHIPIKCLVNSLILMATLSL